MARTMGVDIETYSGVSIDRGSHPYSESPDFEILLISYNIDGGPVKLIDLAGPLNLTGEATGSMDEFTRILFDPSVIKTAYNANFERTCLAQHFESPMPPEQWRCTMVLAANIGLPGKLEDAGAALGIDRQKLTEGKELINYFCKPCSPSKSNGERTRNLPEHDPERWARFGRYNIRDVEAENDIKQALSRYYIPQAEHEAWIHDQHMNDMGVRLDPVLIDQAQLLSDEYTIRLVAEAKELTGLDNPNSAAQIKQWLWDTEQIEAPSLAKGCISDLIEQAQLPTTKRVLELRTEMAKTSVKKYEAMENAVCKDGRAHNMLQFYGANRTGRWAGRTVQVQNLPQNKLEDLAEARELVRNGEFELLEMAYGSPPFVLSQLIRTAFIPSPGCRFIIADFSAIEARVIAWLAGERWVLEEFRGEGKIYEATAAQMFKIPKDLIRKGRPEYALRPKGKVATLACGYQGGPAALIRMGALEAGIPEEDLPGIVKRWRNANKHIVTYWATVENAAVEATNGTPTEIGHGVKFFREGDCLFIRLPSGRRLAYFMPELRLEPKFNKMGLTYMGVDQDTKKWGRIKTYGGKLTENIVQATARDCLRDTMRREWEAGYEIVMHVHDELICDTPIGTGSLDEVLEIMAQPLSWAPGLPLKGAGFEAEFYMKD